MELDHEFTVPVPVEQAWSVLLDVQRVALCVPGATLDSAEDGEYAGRLRVKVGAMTITYRGTARITSADEAARTVTIEAAAKEARGPGTAAATVQARLHPVARGGTPPHAPREPEGRASRGSTASEGDSTRVTVHTKLNVTGRPAQFGRNILAEVGAKLIARFARNLAAELESPAAEKPDVTPAPTVVTAAAARVEEAYAVDAEEAREVAEAVVEAVTEAVTEAAPAPAAKPEPREAPAPTVVTAAAARVEEAYGEDAEVTEIVTETVVLEPVAEPAVEEEAEPRLAPVTPMRRRTDDDAIDLLQVAGPSVAKRALPAAGALVALLLVLRFLARRRRR
ncbi:SRPBCC family protein [Actinomadura macrotermitis]|uniref:Carbon monoxide dehydrogenase subunit G n=1 Tax=Actinomadura macrotermitis TaxID=2585200 RepID=A0A7K0C236_9ACTN|nr:SRPBCC family protein [Actinomadura macrotermitis]MQY07517.1 hypothetical protein [Actinomadura macrotermitis]